MALSIADRTRCVHCGCFSVFTSVLLVSLALLNLRRVSVGIEGAFSSAGAKTVIPRRVVGKFSIRIVPNMEPERVIQCVSGMIHSLIPAPHSPPVIIAEYVDQLVAARKTTNKVTLSCASAGRPWCVHA
jgi:acetylornithine deacetylase/succinyl-diaminopimelate desuccinylase-like protein